MAKFVDLLEQRTHTNMSTEDFYSVNNQSCKFLLAAPYEKVCSEASAGYSNGHKS